MNNFLKQIKKSHKVALFSHISPDPDTIGSTLALMRILRLMGKEADVYCTDALPDDYMFFEDAKSYPKNPEDFANCSLEDYDLLISVDVSSSNRLGIFEQAFISHKNTLKIDHHGTSEDFAKVNLVKIYSACAIIIYEISKQLKVKIDSETATLLYFGICGDTGLFRNNNTNSLTFLTSGELLNLGADIRRVYTEFFDKKKVGGIKLSSKMLLNAKLNDKLGYAVLTATKDDYVEFGVDPKNDNLANISNSYLNAGYKIAVMLKEKEDGVHISLRSKSEYDTTIISQFFGGGGHKNASGCKIEKSLAQAEKAVTKEIEKYLKEIQNA